MWPKRKAKNRRNDRESVLEVKMRSRDARRARFRAVTTLVGAVGGTALGVLMIWQAYQWALRRLVYENEAYTLRRIELRHDGRLRGDQIRHWAGVQTGVNLFAVDLERVRRHLETSPWIARAEVEAVRPDCLRIAVWEREPRAQVVLWRVDLNDRNAWPETNYLDDDGVVLPPFAPQWLEPGETADFAHLTRLTGLDAAEVSPGRRLVRDATRAGLRLIRAYEGSSMFSLVDLEQLDVAAEDTLTGTLPDGSKVVFGLDDFDRQMRRWRSIHDYVTQQGRALEWLDLSVTNNLPARWRESAPTLAPAVSRPFGASTHRR